MVQYKARTLERRFPPPISDGNNKSKVAKKPKVTSYAKKMTPPSKDDVTNAAELLFWLSRSKPGFCCNCRATNSLLWRKGPDGKKMCNPCGIKYKKHGTDRPKRLHSK